MGGRSRASTVDSNTGTYAAATGASYPNSADAELLTPNLDLTAYSSATDITLTFWEFYDTESGWDDVEIWVFSYDRASPNDWTQLQDRSGTNGVWQQNTIDLLAYAGETIYVDFWFNSDGSVNNYGGWYIDDVEVIVTQ